MRAKAQASKELVHILREMLVLQSRDKDFLLKEFSKVADQSEFLEISQSLGQSSESMNRMSSLNENVRTSFQIGCSEGRILNCDAKRALPCRMTLKCQNYRAVPTSLRDNKVPMFPWELQLRAPPGIESYVSERVLEKISSIFVINLLTEQFIYLFDFSTRSLIVRDL